MGLLKLLNHMSYDFRFSKVIFFNQKAYKHQLYCCKLIQTSNDQQLWQMVFR